MDYQRPFNYNTNLAHWRIEDFPLLKVSTNQGGGDCVLPHCYLELEHIATGYKDWIPLNYKECQLIDQYVYLNKEKTICLLYTSPSPRDKSSSRMPSSA